MLKNEVVLIRDVYGEFEMPDVSVINNEAKELIIKLL